ncbi:MAG: tRNA lysidine(34) synthetase TilS, partial [Longimicrobiales bacterium]
AWESLLDAIVERVVESSTERGFELARPAVLSYHPQVQTRLLRRVFRALGVTPDAAGTRAALAFISSCASGRRMRVAGGIELERSFDRLLVRTTAASDVSAPVAAGLTIGGPIEAGGTTAIGGRAFSARWWVRAGGVPDGGTPDTGIPEGGIPEGGIPDHGTPGEGVAGEDRVALDVAALAFPLTLRAWRPGDRIARAYGTKKLTKLFAERRVGVERRRRTPVLADARGRVLWVAGVASAAGAEAVPGRPAFLLVVREC